MWIFGDGNVYHQKIRWMVILLEFFGVWLYDMNMTAKQGSFIWWMIMLRITVPASRNGLEPNKRETVL